MQISAITIKCHVNIYLEYKDNSHLARHFHHNTLYYHVHDLNYRNFEILVAVEIHVLLNCTMQQNFCRPCIQFEVDRAMKIAK